MPGSPRVKPSVTRQSRACEPPAAGDPRPARCSGRPLRCGRQCSLQPRAGQGTPAAPRTWAAARLRAGPPVTQRRPGDPLPRRRRLAAALPPPSLPVGSSHPAGRSPQQEEPPPLCLRSRSDLTAVSPAAPHHASSKGRREEAGGRPAPAAHHEEGLRGAPRPPPQQGRGWAGQVRRWARRAAARALAAAPSGDGRCCRRSRGRLSPPPPPVTAQRPPGRGRRARGSRTSCGPGAASSSFGRRGAASALPAAAPAGPGRGAIPPVAPRGEELQQQQHGEKDAAESYAALMRVPAAVLLFPRYPPSFPLLFSTNAPPRFLRAEVAVGDVLRILSTGKVENMFITAIPLGALKCNCTFLPALHQRMQSAFLRDAIAQQNLFDAFPVCLVCLRMIIQLHQTF